MSSPTAAIAPATPFSFSRSGPVVKNDPQLAKIVIEKVLPQIEQFFSLKKIQDALLLAHDYERKLRLTEDAKTTSILFEKIVNLLFDQKMFDEALNQLTYFSKLKHSMRSSLESFVNAIWVRIFELPTEIAIEQFLLRFIEIIEGKLYSELERAKSVTQLVNMWEKRGDINKALDLILKTHVETYASVDYSFKTKFILEQMRFCMMCSDYSRFELISKKINQKFIKETENEEMLLTYYNYMIKYFIARSDFEMCADNLKSLFMCASIQKDNKKKIEILKLLISILSLSEYNEKCIKSLKMLQKEDCLINLPVYKDLLDSLIGGELIQLNMFNEKYRKQIYLNKSEPFHDMVGAERLAELLKLLENRFNERNVVLMSKYFSSITLTRVAQILQISMESAEDVLLEMIISNRISALINRLGKITITFKSEADLDELETADKWSAELAQTMRLIERTSYMIKNEELITALE